MDNKLYVNANMDGRRAPDVFNFWRDVEVSRISASKFKCEAWTSESKISAFQSYEFDPGPISSLQLLAHDSYLRLGIISLPYRLMKRLVGKEGSNNSGEKSDYFNNAFYPFPFIFGWSLNFLGFIVGLYCWRQANFRPDNTLYLWPIGVLSGVLIFVYGLSILVERSLEIVQ
jgi:hypothetical protein